MGRLPLAASLAVLSTFLAASARAFVVPSQAPSIKSSLRLSACPELSPDRGSNFVSRRNLFFSAVAAAASASISLPADRANAAASAARVAEWPSLAYLEPVYELKLSVDALATGVKDVSKWPLISKRLDKFFKGAVVSEKNYYRGVSLQYLQQIRYDPSELKEYVNLDKDKRFDAFDATLKNLELLKNDIASNQSIENVASDAQDAQRALKEWFSYVPAEDVQAVDKLFRTVRGADANRDGRLDDQELSTLSETDRSVWKKRVELYGDV